jgi:hypothetical protein
MHAFFTPILALLLDDVGTFVVKVRATPPATLVRDAVAEDEVAALAETPFLTPTVALALSLVWALASICLATLNFSWKPRVCALAEDDVADLAVAWWIMRGVALALLVLLVSVVGTDRDVNLPMIARF